MEKSRRRRLIFLCVLFVLMVLFFAFSFRSKTYDDLNIYINKTYLDKELFSWSYIPDAGKYVEQFFPDYEALDFEYEALKFYIFDGTQHLFKPGVSFALDIYPGENFEEVKSDFLNKYNCIDRAEHETQIGDYYCKVLSDCEYSNYIEFFGMVCVNEDTGIIRLFYYYDIDWDIKTPIDSYKNQIQENSSCPW